MFDGKAFGEEIVTVVKGYLEREIGGITARLAQIEKRLDALPAPVDMDEVVKRCREDSETFRTDLARAWSEDQILVDERVGSFEKRLDDLELASGGEEVDVAAIAAQVRAEIEPTIKDVSDRVSALVIPDVAGMIAEAVAAIPPAAPGKDVDFAGMIAASIDALPKAGDLGPLISALEDRLAAVENRELPQAPELPDIAGMISDAVAALPKPEDGKPGKSVTVADCLPEIRGAVDLAVAKAVRALPPPQPGKDGISLAGAIIDRDGGLVVTLSNGSVCALGRVVGKDAEPGKPGLDGVGFDDMAVEFDGERALKLVFTRGDVVKEFTMTLPIPIDRGVFKEGTEYQRGDAVSWGGSLWVAQCPTAAMPGTGEGWRLAVKKGRDGRGDPGKPGEPGKPGRPGRDLTTFGGR